MKDAENARATFSFRVPANIDKKLKEGAGRIGITKTAYILTLIDKALETENKKPPSESATE